MIEEKRSAPCPCGHGRSIVSPSHSHEPILLIPIRICEGLQQTSTRKRAQRHPTIVGKNLCAKKKERTPSDRGHAQAITNYLKSPKHAPYVWGNLRRSDVDGRLEIYIKRSKQDQYPQLVNNMQVHVKIRSKWLAGGIHVGSLPLYTGLQYHIPLTFYTRKPNVTMKPADHIDIGVEGGNISNMNKFDFFTHCYLGQKSRNAMFLSQEEEQIYHFTSLLSQSCIFSRKVKVEKKKIKMFFPRQYISFLRKPNSESHISTQWNDCHISFLEWFFQECHHEWHKMLLTLFFPLKNSRLF